MYPNHKLYICVDIDESSTDLSKAKEIIIRSLEYFIPFENDRSIYDSDGNPIGYIGTEDRDREETEAKKNYASERERCSILRAENKGLRDAVKEASVPVDERIEAMRKRVDTAEKLVRQAAEVLRHA
jgi:hypothetical protein